MKLPEQVTKFGLVGERKAVALLNLGVYATLFGLMGLIAQGQLPEWMACFYGLAACYAIGFFAVAADWFWGRWFAIGLGYSGVTMAIMSVIATHEIMPQMVIFGVMHGLIAVCLLGERMAAVYEAKPEWRERWKLDDQGVMKIKNSVTRAAASLPSLIMWALAPRDGAGMAVLAVSIVGLFGVLRGRTWGLLALFGAGVTALVSSFAAVPEYFHTMDLGTFDISTISPSMCAAASGTLLVLAVTPFLPAMLSHFTRRPE